jgi:sugar O-acyltransferase (sialic acid O-acetyltransferase NeuD family)
LSSCIVGYGPLGEQLLHLAPGSFKDDLIKMDDVLHLRDSKLAQPFTSYLSPEFEESAFYIGLGYNNFEAKKLVLNSLIELNRELPSLIHTSAFINTTATITKSCYIFPMANIDQRVFLNHGVLVNNSAIISHDTEIGEGCYISPGVVIGGNVKIGSYCFIGSGSIIKDGVHIGHNCVIGMGSSVQQNLASNTNAIGNPLKILKNPLNL